MANNCVCNFLSGVWAFVVGSLRVILFIACILTFFSQIINLWGMAVAQHYLVLFVNSDNEIGYGHYAGVIGLALLSLIGAHGAYTRNPKYLKWFALIISIYAVLYFLVMCTALMTTDWESEVSKFSKRMKDNAKEYEFDLLPNEEPNNATKAWDMLQRGLSCCGLKDYHDWEDWRSGLLTVSTRLPKSCCINIPRSIPGKCTTNSPYLHHDGCGERLAMVLQVTVISSIINTVWYLLLASIAIVVAKKHDPDYGTQAVRAPPVVGPHPQYQRFEGSVYVRQPANNEAYIPPKTAPMYPDVRSAEKGPTPPPSYVSRA